VGAHTRRGLLGGSTHLLSPPSREERGRYVFYVVTVAAVTMRNRQELSVNATAACRIQLRMEVQPGPLNPAYPAERVNVGLCLKKVRREVVACPL
jgi:hypothetical protein